MITLGIDPSVRNCGWAVLRDRTLVASGVLHPRPTRSQASGSFITRSDQIADQVAALVHGYRPSRVVIELPSHFGGTSRGRAARNSSSILKLMFCVATIRSRVMSVIHPLKPTKNLKVILVPVRTWKGQVPKHITQRRVARALPPHTPLPTNHNAVDAIGLALWGAVTPHDRPKPKTK